jgi:hypothetical protein
VVFGSEDQPADDGVQAVSSDHEVEPVGGGVLERHGEAVGLLDDRPDRVLEQVLRVVSCRFIEDGGQLTAHDLDVSARDTRHQAAHFNVYASTVLALERDHLGPGAGIHHRGKHAGPFGNVHRRPEQVHGVAAGPHPTQRHPLDHRHREPLPA